MKASAGNHRAAQQGFPSIVELARDKGWIGQALSEEPDWLLREADRWAEWQGEYRKQKRDPGRLPLPDPWQFLLDAEVSPQTKEVCRAAQSQIIALRQLCRLATGVATSNTDWQRKALTARKRGDQALSDHAATKVMNALLLFEPARAAVKEYIAGNAARSAHAEKWQKRRRAQLVRHGAKGNADEVKALPRWREIQARFPIETLLAFRWVRVRVDGPPGFMFWRNEALTTLVLSLRRIPRDRFGNRGRDYIKNLRQNLGLISVSDSACLIWTVEVSPCSEGGWRVKGRERNSTLVFDERFPDWDVQTRRT